jgi:hypothetical protein
VLSVIAALFIKQVKLRTSNTQPETAGDGLPVATVAATGSAAAGGSVAPNGSAAAGSAATTGSAAAAGSVTSAAPAGETGAAPPVPGGMH